MKVLFASSIFPNEQAPNHGHHNRQRLEALAELGHACAVVAPIPWYQRLTQRPALPKKSTHNSTIPVYHPSYWYTPKLWRDKHDVMYRRSVKAAFTQALDEHQPDAVILAFAFPDATALAPLCQQAKLPYAVWGMGSDFWLKLDQPSIRPVMLNCLREAPLIFTSGEALRVGMTGEGIDDYKICAVKNGVDHSRFFLHQEIKHDDREHVVYVGNLMAVKGVDRLLQAWAQIVDNSQTPPHLQIIGDGGLRQQLEATVAEKNLQNHITFLGRLDHDEVATHIQKAKLLCLPSRSEGMPNVIMESHACGTPVVATDVGEVPYMIDAGKNGFIVKNNEETVVTELADAVSKALDTEWDHASISQGVQGATWQVTAETVSQRLTALVDSHGKANA